MRINAEQYEILTSLARDDVGFLYFVTYKFYFFLIIDIQKVRILYRSLLKENKCR